ncbi:hypothetical protein FG386_003188 [Cryptosporidium ryanae]|uniref:uncharacterized protein n=1 Tax=Cryptosporidium ryanae TaxID=515981 RepID=UPI00351A3903|nr:hypothetical protein FG386_003188 [Cryptosporidium ryanae]
MNPIRTKNVTNQRTILKFLTETTTKVPEIYAYPSSIKSEEMSNKKDRSIKIKPENIGIHNFKTQQNAIIDSSNISALQSNIFKKIQTKTTTASTTIESKILDTENPILQGTIETKFESISKNTNGTNDNSEQSNTEKLFVSPKKEQFLDTGTAVEKLNERIYTSNISKSVSNSSSSNDSIIEPKNYSIPNRHFVAQTNDTGIAPMFSKFVPGERSESIKFGYSALPSLNRNNVNIE